MASKGGVAAVDRALAILDAFTDRTASSRWPSSSKRTGLYKSTVIRLAKSLEKFGYLLRTEDGTYRLGSKVLSLGALYQKHFRTAEIVPQVLRQIVDELHEGASFYVRDESQRLCLHRVEASRAVRDSIHEGDRLPLTVGAAGHVILAFSGLTRRALRRHPQEPCTPPRTASATRRPRRWPARCSAWSRSSSARSASPGRATASRRSACKRILPVLFKHARNLTRTLGGNPDAPEFAAWAKLARAAARRRAAAGVPVEKYRAAPRTRAGRYAALAHRPLQRAHAAAAVAVLSWQNIVLSC